jgi:ribosomal protein L32
MYLSKKKESGMIDKVKSIICLLSVMNSHEYARAHTHTLTCGFSREIASGKSSESTTPFTNRIHSGSKSALFFSMSTFRLYKLTPGCMWPPPHFSLC